MQGLRAFCEPMTENEAVQRVEHQPLGPPGSAGDHPDVGRRQATFGESSPRTRAGEHLQCCG